MNDLYLPSVCQRRQCSLVRPTSSPFRSDVAYDSNIKCNFDGKPQYIARECKGCFFLSAWSVTEIEEFASLFGSLSLSSSRCLCICDFSGILELWVPFCLTVLVLIWFHPMWNSNRCVVTFFVICTANRVYPICRNPTCVSLCVCGCRKLVGFPNLAHIAFVDFRCQTFQSMLQWLSLQYLSRDYCICSRSICMYLYYSDQFFLSDTDTFLKANVMCKDIVVSALKLGNWNFFEVQNLFCTIVWDPQRRTTFPPLILILGAFCQCQDGHCRSAFRIFDRNADGCPSVGKASIPCLAWKWIIFLDEFSLICALNLSKLVIYLNHNFWMISHFFVLQTFQN